MEPSVRLYTPNGPGRPRKRVTRPLKQSEVADDSMPVEPAAQAPVVKPARARKIGKKESAAKRKPAKTPESLEPAATPPLLPVKERLAGPAEELPEWAEEAGPVIGIEDFEDIFSRFQTPLTNFVYRLVGNREQAYDLTQDVFVKAYRALSSGTTIQAAALSSWLYRIASNTATDALRRRRLISWLPLSLFNEDRGVGAGMPGADSPSSMQQAQAEESFPSSATAFASSYDGGRFEQQVADREIVQSILQRLPPKYATCLMLYEHEGFSCAEIAEVLNVSPSAVKMRLMRARERFITLYKQETGA